MYDTFEINDFIKAKLLRLDIDNNKSTPAKIIKMYIINGLYGTRDVKALCITSPKDGKPKDLKVVINIFQNHFNLRQQRKRMAFFSTKEQNIWSGQMPKMVLFYMIIAGWFRITFIVSASITAI